MAKSMPKKPAKDGEIERHDAYTRINPSGDEELVVNRKGQPPEETLNELCEDLLEALDCWEEGMEFSGPLPAMSPEQAQYQRSCNAPVLVGSSCDQAVTAGESPNNMTGSTKRDTPGPDDSKALYGGRATARGSDPRNKYIAGYRGDNIDYGATHAESFTGTGAIAIAPGPGRYKVKDGKKKRKDLSETTMTTRRPVIMNEWDPAFSGGEYNPGDYQMPSPTGDGVADRKPKKSKVGSYDTATKNVGKEWPRAHKETAAMCDVDENGVEGKPQGGHKSSVGKPTDGHQSEVSHNWPDQPKNSGSGVAEPFEGTRWADGGTLKGTAPDEFPARKGSAGMPKEGPITGVSGPQMGQPKESWSPNLIGKMIDEEVDLQSLFDSYARSTETVCLEDFQKLCAAYGTKFKLDETSMLRLMHTNREYIFLEGEDANGIYWVATPLAEGKPPFPGAAPPFQSGGKKGAWEGDSDKPCDEEPCDEDKDESCPSGSGECSEGRRRKHKKCTESKKRRGTLTEWQVRSGEDEARRFDTGEPEQFEGPEGPDITDPADFQADTAALGFDMPEIAGDPDFDPDYGARAADARSQESQFGPGPFGGMGTEDECPECGYYGPDDGAGTCPECGAQIGSQTPDIGTPGLGSMGGDMLPDDDDFSGSDMDIDDFDDEGGEGMGPVGFPEGPERTPKFGYGSEVDDEGEDFGEAGEGGEESEEFGESKEFNPASHKAIREFLVSARNIVGRNQGAGKQAVGEALTKSWQYYAGHVDPQRAPSAVQASLQELMNKFPQFKPIKECEAMDKLGGTVIGGKTGGGPKNKFLPETSTEMEKKGEPLGKTQKNVIGTPIIPNTHEMEDKGTVKENVSKLAKHVRNNLREAAQSLKGKFGIAFTCLVQENNKSFNRTVGRKRLAEALADVEELLQVHPAKQVTLEAYFMSGDSVKLKHNIPMIPVKRHAPLREGRDKLLFRFGRHAEGYANNLVADGVTCRVVPHNWGSSVQILGKQR